MEYLKKTMKDAEGAIAIPVIAWFMGVPAVVAFLAWLIFFR